MRFIGCAVWALMFSDTVLGRGLCPCSVRECHPKPAKASRKRGQEGHAILGWRRQVSAAVTGVLALITQRSQVQILPPLPQHH
jgi:hypothetical protein